MIHVHQARDIRSRDGRTGTLDSHLVDIERRIVSVAVIGKPTLNIVTEEDGVKQDVLLHETAQDVHLLVFLQLLATALADNLHIDAVAVEENELVLRKVRGLVLCLELSLINDLDALTSNKVVDGMSA